MLKQMILNAKEGKNLFITDIRNEFKNLPYKNRKEILLVVNLLAKGEKQSFDIIVPCCKRIIPEEINFIKTYINAEIYNILSSIGGRNLEIYIDQDDTVLNEIVNELDTTFCINQSRGMRTGFGNCINVLDRMLAALYGKDEKFEFHIYNNKNKSAKSNVVKELSVHSDILKNAALELDNKVICGIDIGGTDIKVALSVNGQISCFKEYDWNPTSFSYASQLINPVISLTKLVMLYNSLTCNNEIEMTLKKELFCDLEKALDKNAEIELINIVIEKVEKQLMNNIIKLDGIGLSFPDVVIKDKIVGGETTKTRGMKKNIQIDYEKEFAKITDLDLLLLELCNENGIVKNINDGPMAAYTAAVEMMAVSPDSIRNGMFAHSLGTELGTGWVDGNGNVPEMPLECYNFIIDLGNFVAKSYSSDDVRSINNVNTGIAGTLQKYTSQSGVFRLAIQYFKNERPDLYTEIFDKGFVKETVINNETILEVPTSPKDMRKAFLEHIMVLPERENDKIVNEIFKQIGIYLAVTWFETERIVIPACKDRTLFGRVVKNKRCFELIYEGAKSYKNNIEFKIADGSIANTVLMKQLEADKQYTVAQFAQAVGAIYFANQSLLSDES